MLDGTPPSLNIPPQKYFFEPYDHREQIYKVPFLDEHFLRFLFPYCLYNPTYARPHNVTRYKGVEEVFGHHIYVYPCDCSWQQRMLNYDVLLQNYCLSEQVSLHVVFGCAAPHHTLFDVPDSNLKLHTHAHAHTHTHTRAHTHAHTRTHTHTHAHTHAHTHTHTHTHMCVRTHTKYTMCVHAGNRVVWLVCVCAQGKNTAECKQSHLLFFLPHQLPMQHAHPMRTHPKGGRHDSQHIHHTATDGLPRVSSHTHTHTPSSTAV